MLGQAVYSFALVLFWWLSKQIISWAQFTTLASVLSSIYWKKSLRNVDIYMANNLHYNDVIMSQMASQITSLTIVYPAVYSGADQRKHQSYASLAFVRRIHRWPVNSPHKGPATWKLFPFDDVIMKIGRRHYWLPIHSSSKSFHIWGGSRGSHCWGHYFITLSYNQVSAIHWKIRHPWMKSTVPNLQMSCNVRWDTRLVVPLMAARVKCPISISDLVLWYCGGFQWSMP